MMIHTLILDFSAACILILLLLLKFNVVLLSSSPGGAIPTPWKAQETKYIGALNLYEMTGDEKLVFRQQIVGKPEEVLVSMTILLLPAFYHYIL